MNQKIVQKVLNRLIGVGISQFCLCAAGRNAPFVYHLAALPSNTIYHWPEERSAAFFAMGRIKALNQPVVVITTSGTAVGELLPAVMESYYNGLPLILVTADRPKRFRGSGAPQSAEQIGIFSHYVKTTFDIEGQDSFSLEKWDRKGPLHINVCLEEPSESLADSIEVPETTIPITWKKPPLPSSNIGYFEDFIEKCAYPLVIVSSLKEEEREAAIAFLLKLAAPVYLEATSCIREESALEKIAIRRSEGIWEESKKQGYPIDGILRLGSVPINRLWRDLEEDKKEIEICSISSLPFSGLSHSSLDYCSLNSFFSSAKNISFKKKYAFHSWVEANHKRSKLLLNLFAEEPLAEPSLVHTLSQRIPKESHIYLGNSMPIREWDLAATYEKKNFSIEVNRGLNGIDGQISTFFGTSLSNKQNWGLIGDLTAIYDLAAPWILPQIEDIQLNLVIINNKGASIFRRMYGHPNFYHDHALCFKGIAEFWGCDYEKWEAIPEIVETASSKRMIELCPNSESTERFWKKLKQI